MNYSAYYDTDVVNGTGTRCVLFVSGCIHMCKGCYNQATWNPSHGYPYTKELEDQIIADLNDTRIKRRGITLSGGDPMHPNNVVQLSKLCKRIKEECPNKDIWCYSGFTLAELEKDEFRKQLLQYVDVLVDGKFIQELKDPNLKFRGSSNQNIIYLSEA